MNTIRENIIAGGIVVLIASITPCILFTIFLGDLGQRLDIRAEVTKEIEELRQEIKLPKEQPVEISIKNNPGITSQMEILRTQINQLEYLLERKENGQN